MTAIAPARPRLLARPEDLHAVVFHLLVVAAYASAFWLWLHPEVAGLTSLPARIVFVLTAAPLLGWIAGIDVGANFHNHSHRRIFTRPWLNRWFARLWTPVAGWPHLYWQHLHVTVHHTWLLTERDWTLPKKLPNGRFEGPYAYQFWHWPWRSFLHLYRDIRSGWLPQRAALRELGWFLLIWSIPFWIDPWMAVWLWVLPQWCANCITMGRGMYVQHVGCEDHVVNPAHPHSNEFPLPFFNATMFNLGYHALHHDHPGIHWWDLPAAHAARQQPAAPAAGEPVAPSRSA